MARNETAGDIINQVLAETGLTPVANPYQSDDPAIIQLTYLLNAVGRELMRMHPWQVLQREHTIVTASGDSGKYDLPEDFDHVINMTGWSRTQRVKLPGSVTPQIWQYLQGRNLVSSTIYLVYRETENQFWVYPQPPDAVVPAGLTLAFEYMSRYWVFCATEFPGTLGPEACADRVVEAGDVVLFDPLLVQRFLKMRFREARGADSSAARQEAMQRFHIVTSQDVSGDVLNAAGMAHPFPYLDLFRNTPDSGFGM